MTLHLIAALDLDGAIGRQDGGLPWHLPDEVRHFRSICAGEWILVGKRTFSEMDGWFNRDHRVIVLTRHPSEVGASGASARSPGLLLPARDVPEALALARHHNARRIMVIGGAQVYAATLPMAHQLVLSRIALRSGGTVRFPSIDPDQWRLAETGPEQQDTATGITFRIEHWERR